MDRMVRHRRLAKRLAGAPLVLFALLGAGPAGAARNVPGTVTGGGFSPGRAASTHFGADARLTCSSREMFAALVDELELSLRSRRPPAADGQLCAVAEALLGWTEKEEPGQMVLAFLSEHFGLPTPAQRGWITTVESEDPKAVAAELVRGVGTFALNAQEPRIGMATERLSRGFARGRSSSGATRVVLVFRDSSVDLDPFPRRLSRGEQAKLSGRLLGQYQNPKVLVSDAMGLLSAPEQPPGKAFVADVRCGDAPGRIQVAVSGEEKGTARSLASFAVACATELPTSVPVAPPAPWPADPARQERMVLDGINAERAAVGLGALAWDEALAGVARGVSESIRGTSAVPSDLVERLKRVGIASSLQLMNPAQGRIAEEVHRRLLASPSHRQNLMNPEVNSAGVGIVQAGESVYLTQIFTKELPPVDLPAVRRNLRAAVVRKRADARQPAVAGDPMLDEVAEKYAQELAAAAGSSLPKARAAEVEAPLKKGFKAVHIISGARADPLHFAEEPGVISPGRLLGVGVAQGMHPVLGRNAVYVVVLIGARR